MWSQPKLLGAAAMAALAFGQVEAKKKSSTAVAMIGQYPGNPSIVAAGDATLTKTGDALNLAYDLRSIPAALTADIGTYPGYTGGIGVTGAVSTSDNGDGSFNLVVDLANLPGSESGGVHIHSGTTCDTADEVGGHYWKSGLPDPWFTTFTTNAAGEAKIEYSGLVSGYTFEGNNGHAVVIHDSLGTRIGCGVLTAAHGGIHIHSGTTCEDVATVGDHYWTPMDSTDPWLITKYTSTATGTASGSFTFDNGYSYEDNVGHAVVVHDPVSGARIGCGVLESGPKKKGKGKGRKKGGKSVLAGSLGPYPDGGEYYASGKVMVSGSKTALTFDYELDIGAPSLVATMGPYPGSQASFSGKVYAQIDASGSITLEYDLTGVEADCTDCGIHIHTGTTCDVAEDVGGHYYVVKNDPWGPGTVVTTDPVVGTSGSGDSPVTDAKGTITDIFTGYGYTGNEGHAVVVHDSSGTRIGCGVLTAASGGVHIHSGTTCDVAAEVGGHYWTPMDSTDPWLITTYSAATSTPSGSFEFDNGYTLADNDGHAVVVHAPNGKRISCGIINKIENKGKCYDKSYDEAVALVESCSNLPGLAWKAELRPGASGVNSRNGWSTAAVVAIATSFGAVCAVISALTVSARRRTVNPEKEYILAGSHGI